MQFIRQTEPGEPGSVLLLALHQIYELHLTAITFQG